MNRIVLCGAVVSLLAAMPAAAADVARPQPAAPAPLVVPQPVFSWTGFYIGANAGYGWGTGQDAAGLAGIDPKGWSAGGQAGFNYQFENNVVAGIEADLQGTDISGGTAGFSTTLDLLGSVRDWLAPR